MALKYGKTEVKAMVAALDQEYDSIEDAAEAALVEAWRMFEKKAKFAVVGQVTHTREKGRLQPGDPDAVKVALDWYSTEGDANAAAKSLWHNAGSGDTFAIWILPFFHGTPADFHRVQRDKYAVLEAERKAKATERQHDDIAKRQRALEERARGGKGSCKTCEHMPYDHLQGAQGRDKCVLPGCGCLKWKENTTRLKTEATPE